MQRIAYALTLALCTLAAFFLAAAPGTPPEAERDRGTSGAMAALDFWTKARAYPDNDIPPEKYYAAFGAHRRLFKSEPRTFSASGPGWYSIGPDNLAGRMISLAVNPQNPSTLYAGAASGGLWRSRTGGVSGDWQRIATGYPVLGVGAIAVSPADSNVIYIGTGEVYRYQGAAGGLVVRTTRGSYGLGILKTTDGGTTWTKSLDWTLQQQRGVQSIKLNPLNPNTVWAATTEGLYKSTDAGGSWSEALFSYMGEDIVLHATDTNKVLYSSGNFDLGTGIYRTTDGGANWAAVSPTGFSGKAMLDSPTGFPNIVLASIADSTTGVGAVWRSTDFGLSWTNIITSVRANVYGVQGWYSHFVAVHPTNPNLFVLMSVGGRRTSDGGTTLTGQGGFYSDNHDFAIDPVSPNILYVANDDGVYRSTDFGATSAHVSDGLVTGQLYNGFSSSQSDSQLALGQSQDHIPGYLYTGSTTWPAGATDESGWTAINPQNDSLMYAINRYGQTVYRSTNRGASFSPRISLPTTGAWNSPIAVAPSAPSIVYAVNVRAYKSTNAGVDWSVLNGGADLDGETAISIAVSRTSPDTLYVGTSPGAVPGSILRSTNGGTSWTNVTGALPDRYPLDLAVDPRNSRVVYAAFGGYGTGHVFRSTNSGATWTDRSGLLPDIPATALLVDPLIPNTVYLGTDLGVYLSTDAGGSWSAFGDGLPEAVLVSDLSFTASNRTLRVVTHGNGVFERRLPASVPAVYSVVPAGGESWEVGSLHDITWDQVLVPSARIHYSTNDGATWHLLADSASSPYQWTLPPVLSGAARVRVSSRTDTALSAASAGAFTIFFNGNFVGLRSGWNLVSIPVSVADHSRASLFPTASGSAFAFTTSYVPSDSIEEGPGYWVKNADDRIVPLGGGVRPADTLVVRKGWNLIGALSSAVPTDAATTIPGGLVSSLYYAYDGGYLPSDSLRPGEGYWVKCSDAGTLIVSGGAAAKLASAPSPFDGLGTITVADADGRSGRLYFAGGSSTSPVSLFEAPPLPPGGSFDVRFTTGAIAARLAPGAMGVALELTSARFPVTLSWQSVPGSEGVVLRTALETIPLGGSGSVRITGGPVALEAAAAAASVPAAYALRQNYPNPFNPATELRFDLPAAGPVRLTVYSLQGQEIARLVDAAMDAGTHAVRWDAGALPSGVYLVRLTSGAYTAAIKTLLLR
jgi:photosystem II stability/assembly factor-like uncharacterized protein